MSTNLYNPADHRIYPARWPMYRGKQLFRIIDERSEEGKEELLSVSHITGITPRSQKNVTMFKAESLVGYKKCQVGDIAANTMWTWQGAIGVSAYDGVVSPAYNVYRQNGDYYNPRFLDMLLRERKLVDVYYSISTGIRPSRLRLYPDEFLTIRFPVPPKDEQDKIVRYLDWKFSGINSLIIANRKKIDLLNQIKGNLINKAVLGGLLTTKTILKEDPIWGIVYPDHWKIKRIREVFSFRKGLSITKANLEEDGVPVISYGQVHSKKNTGVALNDDLIRFVNESYLESNKSALVAKGDYIFADTSEDLAGCGNCAYVDRDGQIFGGYHTIIMHPGMIINGKYYAYLFQSSAWRSQIRKIACGVKVFSITQRMLKDAMITVPSNEEMSEIVTYLDSLCPQIDALIDIVNSKIERLQGLKTHIIGDVVSGKIDVRNIEIPDFKYATDASNDISISDEEIDLDDIEDQEE